MLSTHIIPAPNIRPLKPHISPGTMTSIFCTKVKCTHPLLQPTQSGANRVIILPMSNPSYTIEVALIPTVPTPDLTVPTISARDAAALIVAVETMITGVIGRDPHDPVDAAEVMLSLAELRASGYALVFSTAYPEVVADAFTRVLASIEAADWSRLPLRSLEAIRDVRRVARKYDLTIELTAGAGKRHPLKRALISTALPIETEAIPGIRGTATLYGTVIRVGGEEPPRVKLRLIDGHILTCDITRRRSWMIARELGGRLYQLTGVRGEARYTPADLAILHFRIDTVLPYNEIGIDAALKRLAETGGDAFKPSRDPDGGQFERQDDATID